MIRRNNFLLIAVVLCLGFALLYSIDAGAQTDAIPFDSPLPLPTAPPTPAPLSPEAEVAVQYIAAHEGIKRERLVFARQETVEFPTLGRKFANVNVFSDSAEDPRSFTILVDMATLTVEPDYNAIRMAEDAAYLAKYGNLNPGLYERLQKIGDEEVLPVAIWVAPSQTERTEEDIQAEVIARFPTAREALMQKGVLWAVLDPDLAAKSRVPMSSLSPRRLPSAYSRFLHH